MSHEWMTKAEVAEMLRVTPRTVENYVKRGDLKAPSRVGGRVLWQRATIQASLGVSSPAHACLPTPAGAVC